MANLPKNTTVDNQVAIVESEKNNHTHSLSQIRGISEDVQNGSIYAEKIDGVTYDMMVERFITDDNNVLEGTLNISSTSSHPKGIVNKAEVDDILLTNNIQNYDLSSLPPLSDVSAPDSIVSVSNSLTIDTDWLSGFSGEVQSNISFIGDTQFSSNSSYTFEITNFNSFSPYTITASEGNASIDMNTGDITYITPDTAISSIADTLIISKDGNVQKEIDITIQQDSDVSLSYFNGTDYELITSTLIMSEPSGIDIRIDNYNPNYTYSFSSTLAAISFTQNDDIITVSAPSTNDQQLTGTVTISRPSSSETFDIIVENFNIGWDLSNISYDNSSYSVAPLAPRGLWFADNGLRLYVSDSVSGNIKYHTLSNAYDLNNVTLSENFDYFTQFNDNPSDIQLEYTLNKMYILEGSNTIVEYNISNGIPSSASYVSEIDVSALIGISAYNFVAFQISDNGSKIFVAANGSSYQIYSIDLSTPWDVSTASFNSNSFTVSSSNSLSGLSIKPDGSSLIIADIGESLSQYTITTPWDLSTASLQSGSSIIETQDDREGGIFVPPNGEKLYYGGTSTDEIYQYSITSV